MDWTTAYHIAGEICDRLNLNITASEHERMAGIIWNYSTMSFDAHTQTWQDATAPSSPAAPASDEARTEWKE